MRGVTLTERRVLPMPSGTGGVLLQFSQNDLHARTSTSRGRANSPTDAIWLFLLMDDEYWAQLPEPLPLSAIARVLRYSETTVLRRLQDGTIPGHHIGGSWIVFHGEFRNWLDSRRNEPLPPRNYRHPLDEYDDELGMSDVMDLFNKTKLTIRRWLTDGQIPGYFVNGRWIVYKSELRDTLNKTLNRHPRG